LVTLQTAHHGSTPQRFASTQRNHRSRPLSTDFYNKIGTFRTSRDVGLESVLRSIAEIQRGPLPRGLTDDRWRIISSGRCQRAASRKRALWTRQGLGGFCFKFVPGRGWINVRCGGINGPDPDGVRLPSLTPNETWRASRLWRPWPASIAGAAGALA
jgi:hypothetical protein